MSCSKPLPPFVCDSLYYLNRDQLERFSIAFRPLKNFIERYLHSKPYRIFDRLCIRGGSYALVHNAVQWHPNRDDYCVQQFLAAEKCGIDHSLNDYKYYSIAEMLPYLGLTVRIKNTTMFVSVAGYFTYNHEHIEHMESIAYLWRNGDIDIHSFGDRIGAEDFQLALNSPTILQCRELFLVNALFPFKDFKVLYEVNVIVIRYHFEDEIDLWQQYWPQFLEQPCVKPLVVFRYLRRETVNNLLDRLSKAFSSAVMQNKFKIVFVQRYEPLIEFRETNYISREKLELKKGLPAEYQVEYLKQYDNYTLERSSM